jgi:branched-chain amino acid transport system substrate-binding protein
MKQLIKHGLTVAVVAGIVAVGMLGCSKTDQQTSGKPTIKIGLDGSLSGTVAFWGESVLQGMQLANEEYLAEHPDADTTIIPEDNQGDPKSAISAMRKLCTVDHVASVVSVMTPFSKPLRPLAAELKTPVLGTVVASLNFGAENEWSFRDYPTPDQLGARIAEYGYNKLNLRRAVCLVVNDEYGKDSQTLFEKRFKEIGGQVLASDTMTQTDTDVRAQVTKLLTQTPDCAYLVVRENALVTAVRQFRELGFKGQILGINAFDSPVVWQGCGEYGEDIVFASALIDYEGNPKAAAFAEAFKKRFSKEPTHTNAYGYSIGKYLLPLAVQANGDPVKVRDLLASLEADSIRGNLKMLPSRDVLTGVAVYQRKGGKNVILDK